jgi:hypothetical protein
MSYGNKYLIEIPSKKGNRYDLYLKQRGYSGAVNTIPGTASPCVISDPNENESKLKPIRGTEMKIGAIIDTQADYDFKGDFFDISDREWQAELLQKTGVTRNKGTISIDTLNITNTSTPATGTIEVTNPGSMSFEPYCDFSFHIIDFQNAYMNFYAAPISEGLNSPDRILLGGVSIFDTDDMNDVILRITEITGFTNPTESVIRYTETDYVPEINSSWGVFIYYENKFFTISNGFFSGSTEQGILNVYWRTLTEAGNINTVTLASHEYEDEETVEQVASDLALEIDGSVVENVYFPDSDTTTDVYLSATVSGAIVTITLNQIGALGNEIELSNSDLQDTYIYVATNDNSGYEWTLAGCSGGDDGGDTFTLETESLGIIEQTYGYPEDTAASIILRLFNLINNVPGFTAEIDANDSSVLYFYYNSALSYRFVTSGGSTLSPSTYTDTEQANETVRKWIGWVIPQLYKQPDLNSKIKVNFSAVCGLGDLKNFTFEINNSRPFEQLNLSTILATILQETGFNLIFTDAWNLIEENQTSNALIETFQDTSRLTGKSYYEVLKEIIFLMGATITQRDGRWDIIPIEGQLESVYTQNLYDSYGNSLGTQARNDHQKSIGANNIYLGNTFMFEPAYRKVITNQVLGYVPQLLKFPNFSVLNDNLSDDSYNERYPWKWENNGVPVIGWLGKITRLEDGYLLINDDTGQSTPFQFSQYFRIADIQNIGDKKQYKLSIAYEGQQDEDDASDTIKVLFKLYESTTEAYMSYVDSEVDFEGTETFITIDAKENKNANTFEADFDIPIYLTGEMDGVVKIYQPESGYIKIKSIKVEVNRNAATNLRKSSYYTDEVDGVAYNERVTSEIEELEINIGDAPDVLGAKQIYKNALYYKSDGVFELTSLWEKDGTSLPIVDWIRRLHLEEYAKPLIMLQATVLGNLQLRDILIDDGDYYMLTGGEWLVREDRITGTWVQTNITPPTTLVTETLQSNEETSGSDSYSTGGGGDIDLSEYLTESQIINLITGATGSFLYSDLTNNAITKNHNLNRLPIFIALYQDGKLIKQSNYDVQATTTALTFTLYYFAPASTQFQYRIL